MESYIGAVASVYVPDPDRQIELGFTHIRIYWAASEAGPATLAQQIELVPGQSYYQYNKPDAQASDWFEWCYWGEDPGESPRAERVPVGPPQATRAAIRRGVGKRLRILEGPYTITSVSSATEAVVADLIDPDASPHRFANRFVRLSDGQVRRTRTAQNNGYVPATGTLTLNRATDPIWEEGDTIELWRPKGDEDPSEIIDEAMNYVRNHIWWRDTFYLTTQEGQTEYALPALAIPEAIVSVERASDTYPGRPGWEPVGYYEVSLDGGTPVLSVRAHAAQEILYMAGDVIRVTYNRFGDRMDSDFDAWSVPLEWAIAEVALAFLERMATPSGGLEVVTDADRARAGIRTDIEFWRRVAMPAPGQINTRAAR